MTVYVVEEWADFESGRILSINLTLEGAKKVVEDYINSESEQWRKTCEGFGAWTLQNDDTWRSGCDNIMVLAHPVNP